MNGQRERRRAAQIMRERVLAGEAWAQCEDDQHDWDEHHGFVFNGLPAVRCVWCNAVKCESETYEYVIHPLSEVHPDALRARTR